MSHLREKRDRDEEVLKIRNRGDYLPGIINSPRLQSKKPKITRTAPLMYIKVNEPWPSKRSANIASGTLSDIPTAATVGVVNNTVQACIVVKPFDLSWLLRFDRSNRTNDDDDDVPTSNRLSRYQIVRSRARNPTLGRRATQKALFQCSSESLLCYVVDCYNHRTFIHSLIEHRLIIKRTKRPQ